LLDFLDILQLIIFTSTGLLLFYLVKFFVLTFVENSDKMKKHLIVFNEASAFGTIILFNLGVFALLGIGV
jgi:hypothetical protein